LATSVVYAYPQGQKQSPQLLPITELKFSPLPDPSVNFDFQFLTDQVSDIFQGVLNSFSKKGLEPTQSAPASLLRDLPKLSQPKKQDLSPRQIFDPSAIDSE